MGAHAPQHFVWDGRTADGTLAPDGVYHPWVHLSHARWTGRFTNNITLDTTPPKVLSATGGKPDHVLFAGPGRTVAIKYCFSETGARGRLPRPAPDHPRPHDETAGQGQVGGDGRRQVASRGDVRPLDRCAGPRRQRDPASRSARPSRSPSATSSSRPSGRGPWRLPVHGARRDRGAALHLAPRQTARLATREGAAAAGADDAGHVPARRHGGRAQRDRRRAGAREVIGLAEIAGPIACIGLAVLLLARTRRNRIAGLCYAGVGSVLLAVSLAPTNAAEIGAAVGRSDRARPAPRLALPPRAVARRVRHARVRPVPHRLPRTLAPRAALRGRARGRGAPALAARRGRRPDARARHRVVAARALPRSGSGSRSAGASTCTRRRSTCSPSTCRSRSSRVSIARLPWRASRVRILYGELVAMALVFAVGRLLPVRDARPSSRTRSCTRATSTQALFRVNSVFFDPSIYGRFLVVALIATAVLIVRGRLSLRVGLAALAFIAVAWLGLLISFSQSSFAALLVAVFALAAIVWRWKSLYALAAVLVVAAGIAVAQPHLMHALRHHTTSGLNHATSGRATLIAVGIKIARGAPVARRRARRLRARVLETHAPHAEAERLAQHAGDRRRGGGRARPHHLLLARRGAAARRVPADQRTAPTDGSRSRPGSRCSRSSSTRSPTTTSSRIRPRGG